MTMVGTRVGEVVTECEAGGGMLYLVLGIPHPISSTGRVARPEHGK